MTETLAEDKHARDGERDEAGAAADAHGAAVGRLRRTTQKFGFADGAVDEEEEEFKPPSGSGTKVREMESIAERISHMGRKDAETIKSLYNIMYSRRFQQKNMKLIKEHVLEFSGIPDTDEKTRQQLFAKISRWMRSYVQDIMDVLGVDRSKKSFDEENKPFDKDSLIQRLIDWLLDPHESKTAKKRSASTTTKKKTTKVTASKSGAAKKTAKATKATTGKRKTVASSKPPSKKAKKSAPVDEEEDATESEREEVSDADDNEPSSDFDEEAPKKKSTKKNVLKKRSVKSKRVPENSDGEESDVSNDRASGDPAADNGLDAEVRQKVKDIIAHGDAEQLTVKKIVRQLSADLGKDLTAQKPAIKDFITNLQM